MSATSEKSTDWIMTTQSADRIGIVAALTACLSDHDGFITELAQFGTPSSERFYSRIEFRLPDTVEHAFRMALSDISTQLSLDTNLFLAARKTPILVMVSKFDHCLADLIYRSGTGNMPYEIVGVVSNHETARSLTEAAGLPFHHIPITPATKGEAEATLLSILETTASEVIVLARYMQILTPKLCRDWSGRIINIHHSFLPSFKGAKPYHRAYARGVKLIGATAHYVTADLDEGPIIEQDIARVDHTMTPAKLIAKGRDVESRVLAEAVRLHCDHRAFLNGDKTVILP